MVFHHKFFRILDVGEYIGGFLFLKNCLTILKESKVLLRKKYEKMATIAPFITCMCSACTVSILYSLYIMNKTQVCNIHYPIKCIFSSSNNPNPYSRAHVFLQSKVRFLQLILCTGPLGVL